MGFWHNKKWWCGSGWFSDNSCCSFLPFVKKKRSRWLLDLDVLWCFSFFWSLFLWHVTFRFGSWGMIRSGVAIIIVLVVRWKAGEGDLDFFDWNPKGKWMVSLLFSLSSNVSFCGIRLYIASWGWWCYVMSSCGQSWLSSVKGNKREKRKEHKWFIITMGSFINECNEWIKCNPLSQDFVLWTSSSHVMWCSPRVTPELSRVAILFWSIHSFPLM